MHSSSTPRFSIVTPSLNQGRFLQDCIDSVRAQNWANVEHFIVDAVSTDETLAVIEANRAHLTGWTSEPDAGAADAINKGLARCTGDIVAWLNADDFYLPGAFDTIAELWRANSQASFWFGNGLRAAEDGTPIGPFNDGPVVYSKKALTDGLDYILQPSTFMNRVLTEKVGGLDTSLRWSFDWDLWIRLAELAPPAVTDSVLAASREWGATLTATGSFKRTEELRLMAAKHSGNAMTPGAFCYWLDNTLKHVRASPDSFGRGTEEALIALWGQVQLDMQRLNVNASGMPRPVVEADDSIDSETMRISASDGLNSGK